MTTATAVKTHEIDATGIPLGRLASRIATILIGKRKAYFTPHLDNGDAVKVVNISKVKVTGKKMDQKMYRKHTGYPGNMKELVMREVYAKDPARLLREAVSRMLPKNKQRARFMLRLVIE